MCEACLQAFDSFVLRCPKDVAGYQQEIARMALQVRGRGGGSGRARARASVRMRVRVRVS
jgi:hypothetical protein